MNVLSNVATAVVTLVVVALGGLISLLAQSRASRLDHLRQWRDIRIASFNEFIAAYRKYVAFILEPSAKIHAVPHPRYKGRMMPFFDQEGRPYREQFESAKTAVQLYQDPKPPFWLLKI